MKISKLYIRIFVSFVAVLIVAEILIFGLFIAAAGRPFKERILHYTAAKAVLLRTVVEQKLHSAPDGLPEKGPSLQDFLTDFATILEARIWLTGAGGDLLMKSFSGDLPAETRRLLREETSETNVGDIRIRSGPRHLTGYYVTIPVGLKEGTTGALHILFQEHRPPHPEGGFALGLLLIGGAVALLVLPVSRAITKRVKELRESALRIAEGDLAHRARVRGKDEIGELGRAFNTMAAKLEQMVQGTRELTANVSHELRSPLARIRVAQELLRDRLERGEVKGTLAHLKGMEEEIELLDRLIGRILALSRMDVQDAPFRPEEMDLPALLRRLVDRFLPAMRERGLRVEARLTDLPPLTGDAEALETALTNLLDNALRYTPEEGRVGVELLSERDLIRASVTNTCAPLPEEELARLFEPFHRIEPNRSPGSGLGLAIAKRIVERHGGRMEAKNEDNELCIAMILPLHAPKRRGASLSRPSDSPDPA